MPKALDPLNYPKLAPLWDEVANGSMEDYTASKCPRPVWRCPEVEHHRYEKPLKDAVSRRGCPICAGQRVCKADYCNSVWATRPDLRDEWAEKRPMTKCTQEKQADSVAREQRDRQRGDSPVEVSERGAPRVENQNT